jgi:hypothetical protein
MTSIQYKIIWNDKIKWEDIKPIYDGNIPLNILYKEKIRRFLYINKKGLNEMIDIFDEMPNLSNYEYNKIKKEIKEIIKENIIKC